MKARLFKKLFSKLHVIDVIGLSSPSLLKRLNMISLKHKRRVIRIVKKSYSKE